MRQIHKVKAKCVLLVSIFLAHCRSEKNTVQCMWQRSSKVVSADRENTEDHEVCKTKEGSRIDPLLWVKKRIAAFEDQPFNDIEMVQHFYFVG